MEWQPVETAPKDGTKILVWNGHGVHTAAWAACRSEVCAEMRWVSTEVGFLSFEGCTHWMPLPAPPESAS